MKLATFFEKFELFADAPDAVARMREVVLELAVRGRLVDQSPADGNAVELLSNIVQEQCSLGTTLRSPKKPAALDGTSPSFQIPSNWTWTKLGNIALQIQYGFTASAVPNETRIRMLRITDIQNNRVDWNSVPGCEIEQKDAEKFFLSPNDILIARTGGTIGKSFIVPDTPVKSVFASYLIRVTPPGSIEARYLKFFLESPFYWLQLREMSAGTGQPNVNSQALGRLEIPLPPLAEQKRIVAKVDALMALCDQLEAQQQERQARHAALVQASLARFTQAPTPDNLQFLFHPSYTVSPADLRQTILTLAVQGKLVPQDPNDEPAIVLLHQIRAHKITLAEKGMLRGGAVSVVPITGDVEYALPPSWAWAHFGEIMLNRDGERIPVSKEERSTKAKIYDYYGASGIIDKIDAYLFDKPLLLIGEDGANLINRSTPIAFIARGKYWVNNHAHVLDGISEDFLQYIELFINAINLERYVTGSAQPKMNQAKMNSIPVALPPLAEQRRIVAKVDELMALVDELESQLIASRAVAHNLMAALIRELTTKH
ncbi:restriction endonuclease subunit S [Desulfobulbus propionicus]